MTAQEMLRTLNSYEHIQKLCKEPLTDEMKQDRSVFVQLSSFSFVLKMALISIVFIGLPMMPGFGLSLLMSFEIIYLLANIITYIRKRHYKSWTLFLEKILRSLVYLVCVSTMFARYMQLSNVRWMLNAKSQEVITIMMLFGRLAEYLFLLMTIVVIVIEQIVNYR